MSTAKEIAQWVVNNRKNDSIPDLEYYNEIIKSVETQSNVEPVKKRCNLNPNNPQRCKGDCRNCYYYR